MQQDCDGIPQRLPTTMNLCVGTAAGSGADFGGAYQVDDVAGWCGAIHQCRAGNPAAGGACACPSGFTPVSTRSIITLPCGGDAGTQIIYCIDTSASVQTFGGVYQLDDVGSTCRTVNPRTGTCSCPSGTTARAHRVVVDRDGLTGSQVFICTP